MSSVHHRELEKPARKHYRQKLTIAGEELPDPLDLPVRRHAFCSDARQSPRVEIGDIVVCLVEALAFFYARGQFKSTELEDGYNFFLSGKFPRLCRFEATIENACIILVTGKVEASQTLGNYRLPWAGVKK